MVATQKTKALIREALTLPTLAPPRGCQYVRNDGCRCIVGSVLHLTGVDDTALRGIDTANFIPNNERAITRRRDLVQEIQNRGLSLDLLAAVQLIWDGCSESQTVGEIQREVEQMVSA